MELVEKTRVRISELCDVYKQEDIITNKIENLSDTDKYFILDEYVAEYDTAFSYTLDYAVSVYGRNIETLDNWCYYHFGMNTDNVLFDVFSDF